MFGRSNLISFLALFALIVSAGEISFTWNAEDDITNYNLYYGGISRNYTNQIHVGNFTQSTVGNLLENVTYYFSVTAQNSSGLESGFSLEVAAQVHDTKLTLSQIQKQMSLSFHGYSNYVYSVEASTNLIDWASIGIIHATNSSVINFTDTNSINFNQRFYRLKID